MSQTLYPPDDRNVPTPAQVEPAAVPVKFATRSMTEMYGPLLIARKRSSGLGGTWTGPEPRSATRISPDVPHRFPVALPVRMLIELGDVVGFVTFVVAKVEPAAVIPGFSGNGPIVQVDCAFPWKTVVLLVRELAVRYLVPFVAPAQIPWGMLPVCPVLSVEVMRVSVPTDHDPT